MDRTRKAIMDAFEALLNEKPYTKISVRDIVERCEISRNTFYYHFQDIPSLLQEMVDLQLDTILSTHYTPDAPIDCIRPLLEQGIAKRRAMLHIYRYLPRERMQDYLQRSTAHLVQSYFAAEFPNLDASNENVKLLIYLYKCAFVGVMLDWMESGLDDSILPMAERACNLLEGATRELLAREGEEQPSAGNRP